MKRNLLMVLAMGIGSVAVAQNRTAPAEMPLPKFKKNASTDVVNPAMGKTLAPHATAATANRIVTRTKLASSPNAFTLLVGESHPLHYNKGLDLLAFTHRRTVSEPGTSGYVYTSFSTNRGLNWDTTFSVITQNDPDNGRYPTGGIYNPYGNTNVGNAYSVVSGPITDGSNWQGNYFGSRQFDRTSNDQQVKLVSTPGVTFQHMARIGSSAHYNGKFYSLGTDYDYNSTASIIPLNGAIVNIGTFNQTTEAFDFTTVKVYEAYAHDPSDDSQIFYALPNMGWSKDGNVGYVVCMGRDSVTDNGYSQPILFRSTDAGATWSKLPVFNFANMTSLTDSLINIDGTGYGSSTGPVVPVWSANQGWDVVVDGNNMPHIISVVYAASNLTGDSIYAEKRIFDVFMDATGSWTAFNVGIVESDAVTDANSAWTAGWDARIQGSINEAGNIMFYSWMDTDPLNATDNSFPNLWAASLDLTNPTAPMATNPTDFTSGTAFDGSNYWMFTAQNVIENPGTFYIPTTVSMDWDPSNIGAGAMEHYYVSGISFNYPSDYFPVTIPLSAKEVAAATLNVSQNYPNPFNGTSTVNVTLPASSDLTFVVRNVMGQVVMSQSTVNAAAGAHKITIDSGKLTAGVYFYTVTAGGEKVTKKMIIE
jgi:hypothetical protein